MRGTINNYRLRIDQLDNGYTVTIDNNNVASKIFENLNELLTYVENFFKVGERTRHLKGKINE